MSYIILIARYNELIVKNSKDIVRLNDIIRSNKPSISLNRAKRKLFITILRYKLMTETTKLIKKGSERMNNIYGCEEIANRYGVRIETVWDWIRNKKLTAMKIGKSYKVREDDLKKFEESNLTTV